ncbi:c-type cytochrome [Thiomicrorhabdus aquaedulcis]|uniref:c-type cytochrome n=1 Tax=Thiomicrorhabdus aquaedulcis TaxID=2211106 RepID=UPI001E532536|nr:hypothetical protein [Thiomicrorhabdus aquaedulcis]
MSGSSDGATASGEKINGKYAANYAEIIKNADGKYLDKAVIEAILGKDAAHGRDGLMDKLDPANPYSFEVDDSIDGGNHGNAQCKIPKAFVEVHENAAKNYYDDSKYVARGFGTPIAEAAVAKWNITVDGDGRGLPDPKVGMTVAEGGKIYVQFCGMCHGEFGEGAKGYLALAVEESLITSDMYDPAPQKAIGNFWPYATTLFDYIRRTMPFWTPNAPFIGDAGYMGMTGYMLQSNYIPIDDEGNVLEDDTFFNSEMLMKMNKYMPNQGNFFCDHRPVIHNARCMTDCDKTQIGDGTGDTNNYRQARLLPDGTPQYNVPERMNEDKPGVGHHGM